MALVILTEIPMPSVPARSPYCVGKWMPSDQDVLNQWLQKIHGKAEQATGQLLPAVEDLKTLIETDAAIYMMFTQMFDQVPAWRKTSPSGRPSSSCA